VTSPEGIARQAELVSRVRAARAYRDHAVALANEQLHVAIRDALDSGARVKDVAAAAGFSRQHISEIYNK
jgi:hypothetical protein